MSNTHIETMLTTVDNPFSPFDEYDEWSAYDLRMGYQTQALLARVAGAANDLSDADETFFLTQAIDEIVEENFNGLYTKVTRNITEIERV